MRRSRKQLSLLVMLLLAAPVMLTQIRYCNGGDADSDAKQLIPSDSALIDSLDIDLDQWIRENPEIEESDIEPSDLLVDIPPFVNSSRNVISLNGADWSQLIKNLSHSNNKAVSIIHIGDSHLQADVATAQTRSLLQLDYGNAGRGLAVPFRLCSTNGPDDYRFSSPGKWEGSRLMRHPWAGPMGFTGITVTPKSSSTEITVATVAPDDYDPFSSVTLYYHGSCKVDGVLGITDVPIPFQKYTRDGFTRIDIFEPQTQLTIKLSQCHDFWLHGALLSGDRPGVFYNVIGNNGATFSSYNRIENFGESLSLLAPNLVIISLGNNEAFGTFNATAITESIDTMVKNIQATNPQAQILLVTPMECQKAVYRKVGKRQKKTGQYNPNTNIKPIRDLILKYGRTHNIATYDWYEVAGGAGASTKWFEEDLFGSDRVHHTVEGYKVAGQLLYDALSNTFNQLSPAK